MIRTVFPTCPNCQNNDFELRVLRVQEVATARCIKCLSHYLLLDYEDIWFDVIQDVYPQLRRCSCKNKAFLLRIDYDLYDDEDGGIKWIYVFSICSNCGKKRCQYDFKVAMTDVDHLMTNPLTPCKNPKILYNLKCLDLHITEADFLEMIDYLNDAGCINYISRIKIFNKWESVPQDSVSVKETIMEKNYLSIYAMPSLYVVNEEKFNNKKLEDAFYKQCEVIRISHKRHILVSGWWDDGKTPKLSYSSISSTDPTEKEIGFYIFIDFSNEYVLDEQIITKSESFRNLTADFMAFLNQRFVTWRGKHSFDNPEVNILAFGERYRQKPSGK